MMRKAKYGNRKTGRNASGLEASRARALRFMAADGQISELREQVKYTLIPSQRIDGKVVERAVTYTADFVYRDRAGREIVEDAKGFKTQQYILRRKMMLFFHGIRILET